MNTTTKQPGLFDREQPTTIECTGGELSALIADLKARGCIILGMAAICGANYRLMLHWPEPDRARFARK